MTPRFDPTRAVVFDLARGQLRDDEGQSRLNVPLSALSRLCEQAGPDATRDFAHGLGFEVGRRIESRLGGLSLSADLTSWTEHLGGQLALLGLGHLQVERWGRALVIRVAGSPEGTSGLVPSVVESALQRATGRELGVVGFDDGHSVACLVLSRASTERARHLRDSGQGLGQVVEALHQKSTGGAA